MKINSNLVIYLKLTNSCNLNCSHCYNKSSIHGNNLDIKNISKVIEFIETKKDLDPLVVFHGGEPLIYDIDKISEIMDKLPEIRFTITTNLIYELTNKHIDLFKRLSNNPIISTSWDHKIRFNRHQEDLWNKNVSYLIHSDINVAPIISVTKYLIDDYTPSKLIDKFIDMGINCLNFERITKSGNALNNLDLVPSNLDMSNWLYDVYKYSKNYDLEIPLFRTLYDGIKYGIKFGCRKRCCQKDVITINPDGTIAGCPNCSNLIYGDIFGNKDENIYNDLINKESIKSNECYLCEYYKYCNGECWQLSWDDTGCPGLKLIIKDMLTELNTKDDNDI